MKIETKKVAEPTTQPLNTAEAERVAQVIDKAWEEGGWDGGNRPTAPAKSSAELLEDAWEEAGWDGANR